MIACPSCGANLKFDAKTQRMLCEFCGSDFDPGQFDVTADAEEQTMAAEEAKPEASQSDTYDVTV